MNEFGSLDKVIERLRTEFDAIRLALKAHVVLRIKGSDGNSYPLHKVFLKLKHGLQLFDEPGTPHVRVILEAIERCSDHKM